MSGSGIAILFLYEGESDGCTISSTCNAHNARVTSTNLGVHLTVDLCHFVGEPALALTC
jgi:hypothetical protein